MTTEPQNMIALKAARERIDGRAALKRGVADGSIPLRTALDSEHAQGMYVTDLLMAQRRWGRRRAERAALSLEIFTHVRVSSLSAARRDQLAALCAGVTSALPTTR